MQIKKCLELGFDVEIDVWHTYGKQFLLGHDEPLYEISLEDLYNWQSYIWIHCKNLGALLKLNEFGDDFNYFWHESDKYTITNNGYIWTAEHSYKKDKADKITAATFGIVTEAYNKDEYYICCDAPFFFKRDYLGDNINND